MKDAYGTISLTPGNPAFKEFARGPARSRSFSMKVSYQTPLSLEVNENLNVAIAISGIGFMPGSGQHVIRTAAEQIDPLSFVLKLQTWGSTQIEFVDLTWHFFVQRLNGAQFAPSTTTDL